MYQLIENFMDINSWTDKSIKCQSINIKIHLSELNCRFIINNIDFSTLLEATPSLGHARLRRCCIRPLNSFPFFRLVLFLHWAHSPRFFLHRRASIRLGSLHFVAQGSHRLHQSTRRADSVARRLPTYNYGESQSVTTWYV